MIKGFENLSLLQIYYNIPFQKIKLKVANKFKPKKFLVVILIVSKFKSNLLPAFFIFWFFFQKLTFSNPLSVQPVSIRYFKFRLFDLKDFIVWNIDIGIRKLDFFAKAQFFYFNIPGSVWLVRCTVRFDIIFCIIHVQTCLKVGPALQINCS